MKKYLPLLLIGVGVVVLAVALVFLRGNKKTETPVAPDDQTAVLPEIALVDGPIASLTPTSDGHFLNLKIDKIKIPNAATMDYEMTYTLPDGRMQGAPGTIKLNNQTVIERKLLLGSESSGKFRYDEGVKEGNLALRFRDSDGRLIAKFATTFALLSNTKELKSIDGELILLLSKIMPKTFFVIMETFGVPVNVPDWFIKGPYGLFTSGSNVTGKLTIGENSGLPEIWLSNGEWTQVVGETTDLENSIFIGTSK